MSHEQYQACIDACNDCAVECDHCASACLKEDDVKMMARCIALDMDCAAVCQLAVAVMARDSQFASQVCTLCATICEACGEECAKHPMDHCQRCAKACKLCAQACRDMASRSGSGMTQSAGARAPR